MTRFFHVYKKTASLFLPFSAEAACLNIGTNEVIFHTKRFPKRQGILDVGKMGGKEIRLRSDGHDKAELTLRIDGESIERENMPPKSKRASS